MPKASRIVLLGLFAILTPGCGDGGQPSTDGASAPAGPHGGVAVPLPDGLGFGEVVIEPASGRGQEDKAQVAIYFLKPDLTSAPAEVPSEVSVKLQLPDREPQTIALSPQPKAKDPAGAGRFASAAGPYLVDRTIGELTATVGGKTFTKPFASLR